MEYSWSTNEESYTGTFNSPEEAIADAFSDPDNEGERIFVAENRTPDPVGYIDADLVLEHIACQDDFNFEAGKAWTQSESEKDDLTARLQKAFTEWMDAHNQHPCFWIAENPIPYLKGADGSPVRIPRCPACRRHGRVTLSPPESSHRGKFFCPCNMPGSPNDSGHFNA